MVGLIEVRQPPISPPRPPVPLFPWLRGPPLHEALCGDTPERTTSRTVRDRGQRRLRDRPGHRDRARTDPRAVPPDAVGTPGAAVGRIGCRFRSTTPTN